MTVRMSSDMQRTLIRYDTKENWDKYNPILEKGELAVEKGSNLAIKCGDGISAWNKLPYIVNASDYIVEQHFVSSPIANQCSYEVYNSGKVLMYGYIVVSANATYVDITPPVTLSKVLLVIPSDAIWATRTAIITPRKVQWNVGSDNTGLINGKIRIILGETTTGADSICYYVIGLK